MVGMGISLRETINSSLIIPFKRVDMDKMISRSVRTERLLGTGPRIGGSAILEQGFTISTMQRFRLMLAYLVSSWLSLAFKGCKMNTTDWTRKVYLFLSW